mgnify:CR=1 FL=1
MPVAGEASAPAGAVYDGDGRLLLGSGPAFSLGLIADRAFQAVLHNLDEPGDSLWLLPEHVLAGLAAVVRAGGKVVVMADGPRPATGHTCCAWRLRRLSDGHGVVVWVAVGVGA